MGAEAEFLKDKRQRTAKLAQRAREIYEKKQALLGEQRDHILREAERVNQTLEAIAGDGDLCDLLNYSGISQLHVWGDEHPKRAYVPGQQVGYKVVLEIPKESDCRSILLAVSMRGWDISGGEPIIERTISTWGKKALLPDFWVGFPEGEKWKEQPRGWPQLLTALDLPGLIEKSLDQAVEEVGRIINQEAAGT